MKNRWEEDNIQLSHGDGGLKTGQLINGLLLSYLKNDILERLEDSAVIDMKGNGRLAFTTDSFVVDPIFFPGGDIGKLSVCGTVNDLAAVGAIPAALSLSLIIEEGFPMADLEKILSSIRSTLDEAAVSVVTGDTKVVQKNSADGIFINTAGIGLMDKKTEISPSNIRPGDAVIINGPVADHGMAILSQRKEFDFRTEIESDCAPLSILVSDILRVSPNIHAMRDATRGGLATVLCEIAETVSMDIHILEEKIPVREQTRGICEFLGMDPLYIANEGKMVLFVEKKDADLVLAAMKNNKFGRESAVIGEVRTGSSSGSVLLETSIGTTRIVDMQYSEQLPRIC